jgi:hypothetical protein
MQRAGTNDAAPIAKIAVSAKIAIILKKPNLAY